MNRWIVPAVGLVVLCLSPASSAGGPVTTYPVGGYAGDVKTGDFDGDGRTDLIVGNESGGTVSVFLGNGDGTVQAARTSAADAWSFLTGDLNGDGRIDLVALGEFGASTLLGSGDGTFQAPTALILPPQSPPGYTDLAQSAGAMALGDLDGDGTLDLVAAGSTVAYVFDEYYWDYVVDRNDGYLNVLLGNGDGTFRAVSAEHLGQDGGVGHMSVADFDSDSRADVLADGFLRRGNGDGTLQAPLQTAAPGGTTWILPEAVYDFDRDGRRDVLSLGKAALVFRGGGDGTFQSTGSPVALGDYVRSAAVGDVDADGVLDLVVVRVVTTVTAYEEDANGQWWPTEAVSARTAAVLLGNGDGTFGFSASWDLGTVDRGSYLTSAALADLDGDGLPELAVTDLYYGGLLVAHNDGHWPHAPFIYLDDTTVTEGDAGTTSATFTVRLSAAFDQEIYVDYHTVYSTDTYGEFVPTAGRVRFAPGETSKTIVVEVVGDLRVEGNETFTVALAGADNGAPIVDGYGVCTIVDNDPRIDVWVSNVSRAEGNSGSSSFNFIATLSSPSNVPMTVQFMTIDGSAKAAAKKGSTSDYQATSGSVTFAPGEMTKTITVQVKTDRTKEQDETFFLRVFYMVNPNAVWNSGQGTILNDD